MKNNEHVLNDRADAGGKARGRILAALLVAICHTAVAEPVVWSCTIQLTESSTSCSLKIREADENVRYILSYGDSRTTNLKDVTETITPKLNRVTFNMKYFGKPFQCELRRQNDGTYTGDCVRDDDKEKFKLKLENPVAAALPRGAPLVPCCPRD